MLTPLNQILVSIDVPTLPAAGAVERMSEVRLTDKTGAPHIERNCLEMDIYEDITARFSFLKPHTCLETNPRLCIDGAAGRLVKSVRCDGRTDGSGIRVFQF